MATSDPKTDLHHYLRTARESLLWKLDGLSEYDVRRPMVPTGTNLLGLVKHLTGCEVGYFGDVFDRPIEDPPPWLVDEEPNADMWATAEESPDYIIGFYQRACAHADTTIESSSLDTPGRVQWWPEARREVTLHRIMAHMVAETQRHAGHADIVRELIDGDVGLRQDNTNLPSADTQWWKAYRGRLERVAQEAGH